MERNRGLSPIVRSVKGGVFQRYAEVFLLPGQIDS